MKWNTRYQYEVLEMITNRNFYAEEEHCHSFLLSKLKDRHPDYLSTLSSFCSKLCSYLSGSNNLNYCCSKLRSSSLDSMTLIKSNQVSKGETFYAIIRYFPSNLYCFKLDNED